MTPDPGKNCPGSRSGQRHIPDPQLLAHRLYQARISAGLSRCKAASLAQIADNSIYRYEKGGVNPRPEILATLARVYGRPLPWFTGEDVAGYGPTWHLAADPATFQETDVDVVAVPVIATVAGSGSRGIDETARDWLPYRRDRLALAGMNPSTCRLVEVRGDAMAPFIPGGAVVLVDLVQHGLWDGRVYLISLANEGVAVRRAHQSGKSWVFRGDHPDSKPVVYDDSWTIHGRVRAVSSISCD